ncbi:MAG TPA: alpha/beta hydrolase [Baekduia sp.]|nr:alpha/beta hydrolase [Baekduia sp.]
MSTVKVNGVQIEYEEWGDGPQTVVMLHNAAFSRQGMEPLAERLKDRYRILLWDYRGMGGSEKPDVESHGMETLYEDAVAIIRERTNEPVHLIGMSLGGCIGLRVAARQPQLVRSLTVMSTSADGAERHAQGGKFFELVREKGFSDPEVVEISMAISFSEGTRNDPARAEEMEHWRDVLRNLDPRGIAIPHSLTTRLDVHYEIQHITAPTLVIAGADDPNHSPVEHEEIQRAIAGSRLVVIENSGHTPVIEQPDAVAEAVRPFLEEVDASLSAAAAV